MPAGLDQRRPPVESDGMMSTDVEDKRFRRGRQRGKKWRRRLTAARSAMSALERIRSAVEADDGSAAGVLNEYTALVGSRIATAEKKLRSLGVGRGETNESPPINALDVGLRRAVL